MNSAATPSRELLLKKQAKILDRIKSHHLRRLAGSEGDIFYISDTYPGLWLEHTYDSVVWADYMPSQHEVSKNQVKLFLSKQLPSGQLPCYIWSDRICYGWTQECVSFIRLAYEACLQNPDDPDFLRLCYDAGCRWDEWQVKYKMPHKTGLIEMFCGYDTGHDNSSRLNGMKYDGEYSPHGEDVPEDDPVLPVLAPDMNAVFYGGRTALADMADRLGLTEEAAQWRAKAEEVRKAIYDLCYDEEDDFFYDVDKNGNKRRIRSISITNVLTERVTDIEHGRRIIKRHMLDPDEFWTPYPFPAVAANDKTWIRNRDGNSWGYYSQGLTALRSTRWMEHYGFADEMEEVMRKWVSAWCADGVINFGQELDPMTGSPSVCSEWYSSCMLYFLIAIRRLYGI